MTTHAPLHRLRWHVPHWHLPHWHLPHLRLEQLLLVSIVAGLALFVLQQVLHPRPPAELTRTAASAAEVRGA